MSTIRIVNVRRLHTRGERAAVCYCGRAWAGWSHSKWANPFPVAGNGREMALKMFCEWFSRMENREQLLEELWEACEHGAKPLGCWCVDATAGDGQEVVCHAQVLAEMLRERFGEEEGGKVG